jgi:lysophospholipase L1-like esterase
MGASPLPPKTVAGRAKPPIRKKVIYALVVMVIFFFGAEMILALTGWSQSPSEKLYTDIYDYRFELVPNLGLPLGNPTFAPAINRHGFHGPEVAQEKAPGTLRIISVGDSTTFGYGEPDALPVEDTYSARLEAKLRAKIADRRVEVINAGIPATCITQHNHLITRKLLAFSPDVFVLYCVPNTNPELLALSEAAGDSLYGPVTTADRVKEIGRRFHSYRALRRLIKGGVREDVKSHMQRLLYDSFDVRNEERVRAAYQRDLERFTRICRAHGIFAVLVYNVVEPDAVRLVERGLVPGTAAFAQATRESRLLAMTEREAQKNGFAFVDPYEYYVPLVKKEKLFIDGVHSTPAGHELLAAAIEPAIVNWVKTQPK